MKLDKTDYKAIENHDSDYLLNKGAMLYQKEKYDEAIEYYRLASTLGNDAAISNLGYCYYYGRGVKENKDLAFSYFDMASRMGNINAMYRIGTMYLNGEVVPKDIEIGNYYFDLALKTINNNNLDVVLFPSLFFSLAKECMPKGSREENKFFAFDALHIAQDGYTNFISEGDVFYNDRLKETMDLISNKYFDDIREEYERDLESDDCDCGCNCGCDCGCDCDCGCNCGCDCDCGCNQDDECSCHECHCHNK